MIHSSPLPTLRDTGDSQAFPEWIQLASGERCTGLSGAGDLYQGQRVSYNCGHNLYVAGNLGGQGQLKTAAVIRAGADYNYTWVGIYQVSVIWLPTRDTTEPAVPERNLDGASIAAYIKDQTGDGSVQCPHALPIKVGAIFTCGGNQISYTIRILTADGEYSVSYS